MQHQLLTWRNHKLQVRPMHIEAVAKGIGLEPEDYDLYGTTKAKVPSAVNNGATATTRSARCQAMNDGLVLIEPPRRSSCQCWRS